MPSRQRQAHLDYVSSSWLELCRLLTREVIQPPHPPPSCRLWCKNVSAERKGSLYLTYSFMFAVTLLMQISYNRRATQGRYFETLSIPFHAGILECSFLHFPSFLSCILGPSIGTPSVLPADLTLGLGWGRELTWKIPAFLTSSPQFPQSLASCPDVKPLPLSRSCSLRTAQCIFIVSFCHVLSPKTAWMARQVYIYFKTPGFQTLGSNLKERLIEVLPVSSFSKYVELHR